MKNKIRFRLVAYMIIVSLLLTNVGCKSHRPTGLLDKGNPIEIQLWHYYNGSILNNFEKLVKDFNESLGYDLGIIVNVQSYGDVGELEKTLYASARQSIGSSQLPDIFATYPDNAYRISELIDLAPLDKYFHEEDLQLYRSEFIEEGRIFRDNKVYILPTAKSTENLFLNHTLWKEISQELGFTLEDLKTWDGILDVSKSYYDYSGNSFFGIDSFANFMFIFAKQNGVEILAEDENGEIEFNFPEDLAWKIWNNSYIPYLNGYYGKSGRFGTDDIKMGKIVAFVGSTAGAGYFPKTLINEDGQSQDIESLVLPYPYVREDRPYAVSQGAGMSITSSDDAREYASSIFLRWFTDEGQNVKFALESSYLPVKGKSYDYLKTKLQDIGLENNASHQSMVTSVEMLEDYKFYSNKSGESTYLIRGLMDKDLYNKVMEDLGTLEKRIQEGDPRDSIILEMTNKTEFNKWYKDFMEKAEAIIEEN